MNHSKPSSHDSLMSRMLIGLLAIIALQSLNIIAFSAVGALEWSWCVSIVLALTALGWGILEFRKAAPSSVMAIREAWASPWPWGIALLLLVQISLYPPMMADSLCYRLPRIFMALQQGGIGRMDTPDIRMNQFPWGWEVMAMPFASLNLLDWSRLINLGAWLVMYQLLFSWARPAAKSAGGARLAALVISTAPVFLLQAASTANDFYASTLLLIGIWLILQFRTSPGPIPVMGSLLALVLAANAKPNYLVLGLPWLLWWCFAAGKPWKQVSWWILVLAAPLYTLVSPLPLIASNLWIDGDLLDGENATQASPWLMVAAGFLQFVSAHCQLPVFPGHGVVNEIFSKVPGYAVLSQAVEKFHPGVPFLTTIDSASFGLIHTIAAGIGVFSFWRGRFKSGSLWVAAVLIPFLIACSQFMPSTIGRSFIGFLTLLFPAAVAGLAAMAHRKPAAIVQLAACLTGLFMLVINPSAPLWPAVTMGRLANKNGMPYMAKQIDEYLAYQERASTGVGILDPVPHGQTVAVLIRQVTPVSPLWQPDWRRHRISFVNDIPPAEFSTGTHQWLLIAENVKEFQPEAFDAYSNLPLWEKISEREYLPTLRQGPEMWTLYRKSGPGASPRE